MQTAVDFIIDQLINSDDKIDLQSILYQAKVLEKDQIVSAFMDGNNYYLNVESVKPDANGYYNFKYHKP